MSYLLLGGPATLVGDLVTITGGGRVRLLATQPASSTYPAMTAQAEFGVSTAVSRSMTFAQIGSVAGSSIASDTPNFLFIDSDGQFYLQNADSDYNQDPKDHVWDFFAGSNVHDPELKLSKEHSQFDTQKLCTADSPVYGKLYSTRGVTPGTGPYTDGNFCDAMGVWVDPDTGDWYTVVHNELYPSIPRIDVLSFAVSKDHGKTWAMQGPIATSPYGAADKQDFYYDYGEGDARLVVDTASGYFYLFYNSRIMKPAGHGRGFSAHEWEHVSRAPIRDKMSPDSWQKFYNGRWSQTAGIDWTCDPAKASQCSAGEPASALGSNIGADADPTIQQGFVQPLTRQKASDLAGYANSTLHTASVAWDVYLGKYIAFAEDRNLSPKTGDYDDPNGAISFYVTDDLSTQKWTYAGSIPYKSSSWYRWFVDAGSLTTGKTIGRTFLAYCSIDCSRTKDSSEYVTVGISRDSGISAPTYYSAAGGAIGPKGAYIIGHPDTRHSARDSESWRFVPVNGDPGFFYVCQGSKYLGVAGGNAGRAWGAGVSLSPLIDATNEPSEMPRQQWYFEPIAAIRGVPAPANRYRLINRYSGLALSFPEASLRAARLGGAVTAPIRDWDATAGSSASFRVWKAADQELSFYHR